MEVLEGFILILLLDGYIGDKKLESLILAFGAGRFYPYSSIDVLADFIFALLLEATGGEREGTKA